MYVTIPLLVVVNKLQNLVFIVYLYIITDNVWSLLFIFLYYTDNVTSSDTYTLLVMLYGSLFLLFSLASHNLQDELQLWSPINIPRTKNEARKKEKKRKDTYLRRLAPFCIYFQLIILLSIQPWLLIRTRCVRRDITSLQKKKINRELGKPGTIYLVPPTILTT